MSCPFLQMLHFNLAAAGKVSLLDSLTQRQVQILCNVHAHRLHNFINVKQCQCPRAYGADKTGLGCGCSADEAQSQIIIMQTNTQTCSRDITQAVYVWKSYPAGCGSQNISVSEKCQADEYTLSAVISICVCPSMQKQLHTLNSE